MSVADYSKRQLKTVRFPHLKSSDLNLIGVSTLLAATYKSNNTMLATANSNFAVTSLTYNENNYYVVSQSVYLES